MTDPSIIQYLEQMCVKNGDIEIRDVNKNGTYTLIIPVYHGAMEFDPAQIATLQMEFSFDGEDIILHNFPKKLLSEEDFSKVVETVRDEMAPAVDAMRQAVEFKAVAKKYGFHIAREGGQWKLCAKNTDNQWARWICFDPQKSSVSIRGNTDHLNIWLFDTRKDLTPEKCLQFVADLNDVFEFQGKDKLQVRQLIDPEDWQEIANVRDAYSDKRYTTGVLTSLSSMIDAAHSKASGASVKENINEPNLVR